MTTDDKRQLLAHVLSGNLNALRDYQQQRVITELDFKLIIDHRAVGGPIEVFEKSGARREMLLAEFEKLPLQARVSIVTVTDTTGGHRIPEPDEDYNTSEA